MRGRFLGPAVVGAILDNFRPNSISEEFALSPTLAPLITRIHGGAPAPCSERDEEDFVVVVVANVVDNSKTSAGANAAARASTRLDRAPSSRRYRGGQRARPGLGAAGVEGDGAGPGRGDVDVARRRSLCLDDDDDADTSSDVDLDLYFRSDDDE